MILNKINWLYCLRIYCLSILFLIPTILGDQKTATNPTRYVSTKSQEANVRVGPGVNYPVAWVFVHKNEPLAVLQEFNEWRKIRDINGSDGWMHSSILSTKRYVIIIDSELVNLHKFADAKSRIIAKVNKNVRCKLNKIGKVFCNVTCDGYSGWLYKETLWGILPNE